MTAARSKKRQSFMADPFYYDTAQIPVLLLMVGGPLLLKGLLDKKRKINLQGNRRILWHHATGSHLGGWWNSHKDELLLHKAAWTIVSCCSSMVFHLHFQKLHYFILFTWILHGSDFPFVICSCLRILKRLFCAATEGLIFFLNMGWMPFDKDLK